MNNRWLLMIIALILCANALSAACNNNDCDKCPHCDDCDSCGDDDHDVNVTSETWTDSQSGLTWQVEPVNYQMNGLDAETLCEDLPLDGGGWRLPTISELRSLVRGCIRTETDGDCGVADDCLVQYDCSNDACDGCNKFQGTGPDGAYWPEEIVGEIDWYWSSSKLEGVGAHGWCIDFSTGRVYNCYLPNSFHVRCVR